MDDKRVEELLEQFRVGGSAPGLVSHADVVRGRLRKPDTTTGQRSLVRRAHLIQTQVGLRQVSGSLGPAPDLF